MRKYFLISIFLFSFTSLLANEITKENIKTVTFFISKDKKVELKLLHIKDKKQRALGLSHKKKLGPYDGLILEFEANEVARIWMKDMNFPIDIIFLSKDGELKGTVETATPCQGKDCTIYGAMDATYAIETKAGFIIENFIHYTKFTTIK